MSSPLAPSTPAEPTGNEAPVGLGLASVVQFFAQHSAPDAAARSYEPRSLSRGEAVNDAGTDTGPGWNVEIDEDFQEEGRLDLDGDVRAIAAIDCGLAKLGATAEGEIIAVRGAIVVQSAGRRVIYTARPGLVHLTHHNRLRVLHQIGTALGDPEHFVRVRDGVPYDEKGMNTTHQLADRVRNLVERALQFHAASLITSGIVVLDGAITPDSWDTPPGLVERLADVVTAGGNHLLALSKKTTVTVNERELRALLDDAPAGPRFLYLNEILRRERLERAAAGQKPKRRDPVGHLYAARFGAMGETYRLDVVPAAGFSPGEALASFNRSSLMRAGYPDVLVRAHLHSYFSYPDVLRLQAAIPKLFGLVPRRPIDHAAAFAPFGGRWK
jgi:hypothetical protein